MKSSRIGVIGIKAHCNACAKEFPIGYKYQTFLRNEQPIKCNGCKSELVMSAPEMQRFLALENPAKPLMLAVAIINALATAVMTGNLLGLLKSDAWVLMTVAVFIGSNVVLGRRIENATQHLRSILIPRNPRQGGTSPLGDNHSFMNDTPASPSRGQPGECWRLGARRRRSSTAQRSVLRLTNRLLPWITGRAKGVRNLRWHLEEHKAVKPQKQKSPADINLRGFHLYGGEIGTLC